MLSPSRDGSLTLTKSERRSLGRFDTPRPLAQAITDWAFRNKNDYVLEHSSGGGCIVRSIASRLIELGSPNVDSRIVAADIDHRALRETARCCAPYSPKLILGSFLELDVTSFDNNFFDVVIGNPPYVRLHTMDQMMRAQCRNSLPETVHLDAKASLWAYFPIHALKFLKPGGRMAWILPETILHSDYGKQLLRWIALQFGRCIAVSLRERCFMDDGAKERVVILLLEGANEPSSGEVEMIEFGTANDCIAALPLMAKKASPTMPKLNGHAVPHLVSDAAARASSILEMSTEMQRLGEFADIRIGVVTGNNKFFVLSEAQRREKKLRPHHFQSVISKFVDLGQGFDHQGGTKSTESEELLRKQWLLCPNPSSKDKALETFLSTYPETDIQSNQTMRKRRHWQVTVLGNVPDAFLQYMGKSAPRLVLNSSEAYCTNTIHRVFFNKGVSKQMMRAISLSIHSTYSQLSAEFEGRQYGSGVLKLEPSEAKRISFGSTPNLLNELATLWKDIHTSAVRDGWQSVIEQIDQIVVNHCPKLASDLPINTARELLKRVRCRRKSHDLLVGV